MYCSSCGSQAASDSVFCHKCGARVSNGMPASPQPVTVGGITFTPGCGERAGLYSANGGRSWVRIVDGQVVPGREGRSVGRTIGGVLAFIGAGFLALLGWGWSRAFLELEGQGNDFAAIVGILGIAAWVAALAFVVGGFSLLSRK